MPGALHDLRWHRPWPCISYAAHYPQAASNISMQYSAFATFNWICAMQPRLCSYRHDPEEGYGKTTTASWGRTSSPPMWMYLLGNSASTSLSTPSRNVKVSSLPCAQCRTPFTSKSISPQKGPVHGETMCTVQSLGEPPLTAQNTSSWTPHCVGTSKMSPLPA